MAAVAGSDPFEVDGSQRLELLDVRQGSVLREPEEAVLTQPCAAKSGAAEGAPRDELGCDCSWFSGTELCSGEEGCLCTEDTIKLCKDWNCFKLHEGLCQ